MKMKASHRSISVADASRGYTVVEIMMATAIFAVGVTGIVAMELGAAQTNTHAKDVAVATALARSWQDRLAMDATLWGGRWEGAPGAGINQTTWIQLVNTQNNTWILPGLDTDTSFGPAADARGAFVNNVTNPQGAYFCTHIRLTHLVDRPGSGLIRAEVRVFWPGGPVSWAGNYCAVGANVALIGNSYAGNAGYTDTPNTNPENQFHFVYKTSAIRETPAF